MAEYKITIDTKLIPMLEALAKLRGLSSVEEALSVLITEQLDELSLESDPIVGFLDGGPEDLAERDEDYLYSGWQPD